MRRIESIRQLRGCGVFRDFAWPSGLSEFGRYNLIYGWNGTGKTTLSRLFRDLELRRSPKMGGVILRIDESDVRGESFLQSDVQVRVFNRDFISENVFPVERDEMPPILVLGTDNVEKQKEVDSLVRRHTVARSNAETARSAEKSACADYDRFCIDRARVIKDTLRASGDSPYNNYNKSKFKADAMELIKAADVKTHRLPDTEREKLLAQHQENRKHKVPEIRFTLPNFSTVLNELSELLTTTVESLVIEALKTDPDLADWTRKGLNLHRDREAELCLFCEQLLPMGRLATLTKHFSDQYERFIQRIDQEIEKLDAASAASATLQMPAKAELYDDLGPEFESRATDLKKALELTQDFVATAIQTLKNKKSRVFDQVVLQIQVPSVDTSVINELNEVIEKHNQFCDEFESRVNRARERLAGDLVATELEEFIRRKKTVDDRKIKTNEKEEEARLVENKITELEREIVEHRRPAEELNRDLRGYLGHNELSLEIKDKGYAVNRGGVRANSLSEGETTAIALLYFLKSLNDRQFTLENGVVVLDDPVSSLDANALFLAFGFIRERTKSAGQLFVLTHNFSFFRQVRNWFHNLPGKRNKETNKRPARFFMLDIEHEENLRSSVIQWLDPLLEKFDSEYHYLFSRVHRASTELASQDLEQNYVLPNMARRMLEAFLAFRSPRSSGNLWQKMKDVQFDEAKKIRILRFLNTYSHNIAVGEPEHDMTALAEGPAVLKDLLEMMESLDNEHYSAMLQLVAPLVDALE